MKTSREQLQIEFFEAAGRMYRSFLPVKRRFLNTTGLNRTQVEVLGFISSREKCTIKSIAAAFNITSSAATQLVEGLVKKDLMVRVDNPDDRRTVHITLSKNGRKKFQDLQKTMYARLSECLKHMSDEELVEGHRIALKIAEHGCKE